jgi:hypothetical protein
MAGGKDRVLKLGRMLYGLHQAPRGWSKKLENALRELGFVQSDTDPSLWLVKGDTGAVVAMFYVDDGLVAAPTAEEADAIVDKMGTIFEIRKLGEPTDSLGINIHTDEETGTITIDQEDKARAIAEEFGVANSRKVTPMSPDTFMGLRKRQNDEPTADKHAYQRGIGALFHVSQCTRADSHRSWGSGSVSGRTLTCSLSGYVGCYEICGSNCSPWDNIWHKQ